MSECVANPSYGDYILRTGHGIIGQYELMFGRFLYQNFRGRDRVVDLGPGRCWFTKQNPASIVAVDNSVELVRHFGQQGIDIRLGDAYDLGLADRSVDGVFCCWVFEHLPNPLTAMLEMNRVMQPGAYGMIIVPSPHDLDAFYDDYTHIRPFTRKALKQLAEDAGFTRHKETFLPFARGSMQMLHYLGEDATLAYLNFSERYLRGFGIVNRTQAVLEFWKD